MVYLSTGVFVLIFVPNILLTSNDNHAENSLYLNHYSILIPNHDRLGLVRTITGIDEFCIHDILVLYANTDNLMEGSTISKNKILIPRKKYWYMQV